MTRAELVVFSAVHSADDLAALVGLTPDEWFDRGELVGSANNRSGFRHKYSCVEYHSNLPTTLTPEEHLAALLERVWPHRHAIRAVAEQLAAGPQPPVRIWVFHTTYREFDGLGVNADTIWRISVLNVAFKFMITAVPKDFDEQDD